MNASTILFACLGNPGSRYSLTRHNIGFAFADTVCSAFNFPDFTYEKKFLAFTSSCDISGQKIMLLKPDTYMNLSGDAVGKAARYFSVLPDNIYAVHDDMDFSFGIHKIRKGGGAGGHKGILSVTACLGTEDYYRIRLGVGRPEGHIDGADFVLSKFKPDELAFITGNWSKVWADIFKTIAAEGPKKAMNTFNKTPDAEPLAAKNIDKTRPL